MNIAARILNFSLMIAMPFGLAIYLFRKYKPSWSYFGIGAVTFILSQVFHIPFNALVLNPLVENWSLDNQKVLELAVFGLVYGLSAGVFEEITRYLGYKFWIKGDHNWSSALMYGAGHGGIELVILGGIVLYAFIQAITLQGVDLSTVVDPDQVELASAQIAAYWAVPWHLAVLGAVERLATIVFHLSATVLVLQSFTRKNMLWLVLAIAWHTFVDAVAVFASQSWNPYVTEAIILGMGVLSLGIIIWLRIPDMSKDQRPEENVTSVELDEIEKLPIVLTEDVLDDSRFS